QRLRIPGRSPARPGQRAGEDQPRAPLPAEHVQVLGPRPRAPPALRSRGSELVRGRARVLMVHFDTPTAGLVALAGLVPLVLVLAVERRNERARALLRLSGPSSGSQWTLRVAVVAIAAVLGLAAAQPVLSSTTPRLARLDAEALVAVDTSRSMDASTTAESDVRLDRARRIALRIRAALTDVPTGLGTFTDRPLPLLLPTTDRDAFASTVEKSLG